MTNDKRIYELEFGFNTQDAVIMIDADGDADAKYTPLTYHVVSTLPSTPVNGWIYHLDTVDGLAPIGTYIYKGGWACLSQTEVMQLPDWSGDVVVELISGVSYSVSITANITLLALSLSVDGTCRLVLDNPLLFSIETPVGIYSTTYSGMDALSNANVRVSIQLDDSYYEWCTTDRVQIPRIITDEVFALEATTTSYIDSGILLTNDSDFEYKMNPASTNPTIPFGSVEYVSSGFAYGCVIDSTNTYKTYWGSSSIDSGVTSVFGEYQTSSKEGTDFVINLDSTGEIVRTVNTSFTPDQTLTAILFGRNTVGGVQSQVFNGHISYLKVWSDATRSTLVADMISVPLGWIAEVGADVATENGMYCKIRQQYFYNLGTGSFNIEQLVL